MKTSKLRTAVKDAVGEEQDAWRMAKIEEVADELNLSEEGREELEDLLATGSIDTAESYLCTAVDFWFMREMMSLPKARAFYRLLGVSGEHLEMPRQEMLKFSRAARATAVWEQLGEEFDASDPMNWPRSRYH